MNCIADRFICFCCCITVPIDFDPQRPGDCVCDPSTGFNTVNSPTCNNPICLHNGTYTPNGCECYPPYTSTIDCNSNTCNNDGVVIPWIEGGAGSPYKCSCPLPFAPSNELTPYDCSGSKCGPNGSPNPFYQPGMFDIFNQLHLF